MGPNLSGHICELGPSWGSSAYWSSSPGLVTLVHHFTPHLDISHPSLGTGCVRGWRDPLREGVWGSGAARGAGQTTA